MLVVIEGLDGAGKSTQVRLMREYLEGVCLRLDYIHFPRYDAPVYGGLIGKFLRGGFGPIDGVHPQLVALLFAEDRHGAAPAIKEALASGGTVLLDRYVYSNIAYQCAKMKNQDAAEDLREWILNTEFGTFDLPRPDLNIFLDVPIGFVEESLSRSRSGSDRGYLHGASDIHEADIEFQKRVRAMYLRQASLDPSLVVVDCSDGAGSMLPPEQIFQKLKEVYESR
jgi:dTMP kinase